MKSLEMLQVFLQSQPIKGSVRRYTCHRLRSTTECFLTDLTEDSRQILPGAAFVALSGLRHHGLTFLTDVLARGAFLIISDRAPSEGQLAQCRAAKADWLYVPSLPNVLTDLAVWFFEHPSQKLTLIGITGTNGKTSTAFYTAQLLEAMGKKVGLIGTLGNGPLSSLQKSHNTTPGGLALQRLLAQFVELGLGYAVMEVSSHAIALGRIAQLQFSTLALTQVTSDHLDFHGSQAAYEAAKVQLFHQYPAEHKVINLRDSVGQSLLNEGHPHSILDHPSALWGYALNSTTESVLPISSEVSRISGEHLQLTPQGMRLQVHNQQHVFDLDLPLLGAFNAENVLCALSCLAAQGFALADLICAAKHLRPVVGRMERVASQPMVLVDFAHTEDALEKLLIAARAHQPEAKLWVLFGCGGDRDVFKRPKMGAVAERLADQVFLTSDNPRSEPPEAIIEQILAGMQRPQAAQVVVERQAAIESALRAASVDLLQPIVLVIAGKGHEDYQEIQGQRYPFLDQQVVRDWMKQNRSGGAE
ncbi:MAG: UDP-N-acetylmuramoyl-L-alanyl-D-glutamate--2,6-diaminopimelate ligase [Thiotrichales bacterium]|nr:UDP-N-acetylmuramoyl-L-alanyl-D-glutamate--2,6-diaminopimelate ligase [Thiotrichales bacterium]